MAQRLEIELTSTRDDGMWTWRAAGARQPRGEIDGSIVPDGAKVGDIVKVEAETSLDGLEVTTVFAPQATREGPELLEMIGSGNEGPLVSSELIGGRGRGRGDRSRRSRPRRSQAKRSGATRSQSRARRWEPRTRRS